MMKKIITIAIIMISTLSFGQTIKTKGDWNVEKHGNTTFLMGYFNASDGAFQSISLHGQDETSKAIESLTTGKKNTFRNFKSIEGNVIYLYGGTWIELSSKDIRRALRFINKNEI